jgi:hypothetical protein
MSKADKPTDDPGTWIFRDIPREVMRRAKAGAAIEGKNVRGLVIELVEAYLEELEKKGKLPKSK